MSDRLVEVRLRATGAANFQADMLRAAQATEQVGKSAQIQASHASMSSRALDQLRGAAKGALSTFLGFSAAQAGMAIAAKGVGLLKTEVLGLDDALTQSTAIMAHVSGPQRFAMETAARSMAQQWGISATTIAHGFYYLASAGMDVQQSIRALPQVVAFAKAGMFDLETATSLAVDAQTAMGLRSADAEKNLAGLARTTDVLTEAANASNGSVEQFSEALTNKAAAAGKAFGVSLEETTGTLAAFADTGVKGRRAGEAFSILLRELTTNASKLDAVGVSVYDLNGNLLPLDQTIASLETRLQGLTVEQKVAVIAAAGFSDEGRKMVLQLLGSSSAIRRYTSDLKAAGGATQDVAKKQMTSIVAQLSVIREKAIELSRKGIDGLAVFVAWLRQTFGPAFAHIADVALDVWNAIAPIGKAFAGGAFLAGKIALEAIAAALEHVAGFLHDNAAVVQIVSNMIVARLIVALTATSVAALQAGAAMMWTNVQAGILTVRAALAGLVLSLQLTEGAAAKTGVLLSAIGPTAGIAAIGLSLYMLTNYFHDAEQAADKFVSGMRSGFDETNANGLISALNMIDGSLAEQEHRWDRLYGSTAKRVLVAEWQFWTPAGNDVENMIERMDKLRDEAKRVRDEISHGLQTVSGSQTTLLDRLFGAGNKTDALTGASNTVTDFFAKLYPKADVTQRGALVTDYLNKLTVWQTKLAMQKGIDIWNVDPKKAEDAKRQLDDLTYATLAGKAGVLEEAKAFGTLSDETSTAEDKLKAYTDLLDLFVGKTLASQGASLGFNDALRGLRDSFDETKTKAFEANDPLSKMGKNADANKSKLLALVSATLDEAKAVADQTESLDRGNQVLKDRRKQIEDFLTVQLGGTQKARVEAGKLLDSLGLTKENFDKLVQGSDQKTAQGQLDDINQSLDDAALLRSLTIDSSSVRDALTMVNRLRTALGLQPVSLPSAITSTSDPRNGRVFADGGLLRFYANGSAKEDHTAQVAKAGSWRVWAEPETGGEAYIPLAMAKRAKSLSTLRDVAAMFGYKVEPKADGGLSTPAGIIYAVGVREGFGVGQTGQIGQIAAEYSGRASFAAAAQQARIDNPTSKKDAASIAAQQKAVQDALLKTAATYWQVADVAGKSAAEQLANSGLVGQAYDDAAQKIIQAAEEAKRALTSIEDNQASLGAISTDRYLAILQGRLAGLQRYSDEWTTIQRQIASVTREREDNMYTLGKVSTERYLALLKERQQGTREYSAEWMAIQQQMDAITSKYSNPIKSATSLVSAFGGGAPTSFGMVSGALTQWISTVREWGTAISDLSKLGLNRTLLDQLMQAGPQALPLARALLTEGAKGIASINGQLSQLDSLTTGFANGAGAMLEPVRGMPAQTRVDFGKLEVLVSGLPEGTGTADAERILTTAMESLVTRIGKG